MGGVDEEEAFPHKVAVISFPLSSLRYWPCLEYI